MLNDIRKHPLFSAFLVIMILYILISIVGCASSPERTPESVRADVVEAKHWYCGPGMMGIRAVARFVIALTTGTSIPNLCRVIDAVVDAETE